MFNYNGFIFQANLRHNMEEGIGRAVLANPVPRNARELPSLGVVWAAGGASWKHSSDHH